MIINTTGSSDNNDVYIKTMKKLLVYQPMKKYADLQIKLKYDKISANAFFLECINAYLNDEEVIRPLVARLQKNKTQKRRIGYDYKAKRKIEQKFDLNPSEIHSIFDFIEQDHEDL